MSNIKQTVKESTGENSIASKEYQLWWEVNKDRVLSQDRLRHEMDYKQALAKHINKEK